MKWFIWNHFGMSYLWFLYVWAAHIIFGFWHIKELVVKVKFMFSGVLLVLLFSLHTICLTPLNKFLHHHKQFSVLL
jgi:hypothetical protein